jgi:hypothetical protein
MTTITASASASATATASSNSAAITDAIEAAVQRNLMSKLAQHLVKMKSK